MQSDSDDVFIKSLQKYLHANRFSSGSSHKLWQTVADETGLPIVDWMQQWTYSGGFPLVSASLQGNQVTLSQVSKPTFGLLMGPLAHSGNAFWPITHWKAAFWHYKAALLALEGCPVGPLPTGGLSFGLCPLEGCPFLEGALLGSASPHV